MSVIYKLQEGLLSYERSTVQYPHYIWYIYITTLAS
jgi:hypothetical protein